VGPVLTGEGLIDPMFSFKIRGDVLVEKELCGHKNGVVGNMNAPAERSP
jgi:hypothetical protein